MRDGQHAILTSKFRTADNGLNFETFFLVWARLYGLSKVRLVEVVGLDCCFYCFGKAV